MLDNRGCGSGGTGVDIVNFGISDASQNELVVQEVQNLDSSLLNLAKQEGRLLAANGHDLSRSLSPIEMKEIGAPAQNSARIENSIPSQ